MKFIYLIERLATFSEGKEIVTVFEEKEKALEWLKEKYEYYSKERKYSTFGGVELGRFIAVHKEFATSVAYNIQLKKVHL